MVESYEAPKQVIVLELLLFYKPFFLDYINHESTKII